MAASGVPLYTTQNFTLHLPVFKPAAKDFDSGELYVKLSCQYPVVLNKLIFSPGVTASICGLYINNQQVEFEKGSVIVNVPDIRLPVGTQVRFRIESEELRASRKHMPGGFLIGDDGAVWQYHDGTTDILQRVLYTVE